MAEFFVALCVAAVFLVAGAVSVSAHDADPINDYCVADLTSKVLINGLVCKPAAAAVATDFAFEGFRAEAPTNNPLGIGVIPGFAGVNYPALNTQGLALAKFNYAVGGLVPPHTHPRAAEVITVTKGIVFVGFVDTAGELFAARLRRGDFFLFPVGLVHFQLNAGRGPAETISVLNAQNPGVQFIANSLFGSAPSIDNKVLAKAFGISPATVAAIQKGFAA